ncbi:MULTISPECIES: FliH/SctL family protein [unclassified Sphingomonas]|uniref:FliH/SctL family protein n=1 Tax=unclassified Sphingomonas TaxID=196159 RepID=UPI000836A7E9|nr:MULTISPECIES: FliH/SctL family protein [unclassified Sphingomonas]
MSDFAPGFASRHASVSPEILSAAFAPPPGFMPGEIKPRDAAPRTAAPRHFTPETPGPRHFSPADRDRNPTEGWDPFDTMADVHADAPPAAFVDPIAQARASGFADGMAAAMADAAAARARDEQLLSGLADALRMSGHIDRNALAERLRHTVLTLVARLVGETGISAELLQQRIASAVELIAEGTERASVRLHPSDIALVRDALPPGLSAVADAAIGRGAFVIESPATVVEDGPTLWLEQLTEALDRAALPGC